MKKLELAKAINWDIKTEPVLFGNNLSSGKKAITRNDNGEVLGIVGINYSPVSNQTIMQIANAIAATGHFEVEGYAEYNQGRIIQCFLSNKNVYLNINGHKVFESMIISNSHDGTTRLSIAGQTRMARCGNLYSRPLKVFSKKHIAPLSEGEINVNDIIKAYQSKKDKMYSDFDGMDQVKVTPAIVNKLIMEIHRMLNNDSRQPKDNEWMKAPSMRLLKESIDREMTDLGNNVFGLFNGVTWYTSHEMRNHDSELGRLNGTAGLINQKAFRFCNNLKNAHLKINS